MTDRKNAVQHGTPQGYKKHLKSSSGWGDPCDDCKAAHTQAMKEYRERNGRDRTQENDRRMARQRALSRLSEKFPRSYKALLNEELIKIGASR